MNEAEKKEIVLTVNGPGELAGLAVPLIKEFKRQYNNLVFTVFTVPCQFGSGLETETAKGLGYFDHVFSVKEYQELLFKNKFPKDYQPLPAGIVFYIGGDSFHALALARKLKYEAYAYDEGNLSNKHKFKKLFTRNIDGDLMVDAARERNLKYQAVPIGSEKMTVGLYPGSRPKHLELMVPFLSSVAGLIRKKYPNIQFRWGINENLKKMFMEKYQPKALAAPYESPGTTYDLIISLTGTNTAISAALGIPMIVLLPFNDPSLIPFMGLFGLLAELPLLGILLKRLAIFFVAQKLSLVAIPNIKAGRKIVPELVGVLKTTDVAAAVESLLINIAEREKMHYELPIYMDKPAAKNIAGFFQGMF